MKTNLIKLIISSKILSKIKSAVRGRVGSIHCNQFAADKGVLRCR